MKHKYITISRNKFRVQIYPMKYIGTTDTLEEAIKMRDEYLIKNKLSLQPLSKNYVEYKDMNYEMIISLAQGKITRKLMDMFILTNKRVNRKFFYKNELDRQDVMQFSICRLLEQWYNCDMDKTDNCFPYVTEIIKRAHAFHYNELMIGRSNISIQQYGEFGLYDKL